MKDKNRGLLGLPRFTNIGPLVSVKSEFSQELSGLSEHNEAVTDIIENMDTNDPGVLADELAKRTFPNSSRKRNRFKRCLTSNWADGWSDGFAESSGAELSAEEDLVQKAAACSGLVEANTID